MAMIRNCVHRRTTGVMLLMLLWGGGRAVAGDSASSPGQMPTFSVTRMSQPPTIDGAI